MEVKVYRNSDTLRLRKVVVEIWHDGHLLNRSRMMVWGPFTPLLSRLTFAWRLQRRIKTMQKTCGVMLNAMAIFNK
jgi:hypothetical protein